MVILGLAASVGSFPALRAGLHTAIVLGLRAPRAVYPALAPTTGQVRFVSIPSGLGSPLAAWYLMPAVERPAPEVVLMHGRGAHAASMLPIAEPLQAAGRHVLIPDARCHGRSADLSFRSLARFAEDIDSSVDWSRLQSRVDLCPVAVIGHSVGAAAALLSASRRSDLAFVVRVSSFAHPGDALRR